MSLTASLIHLLIQQIFTGHLTDAQKHFFRWATSLNKTLAALLDLMRDEMQTRYTQQETISVISGIVRVGG